MCLVHIKGSHPPPPPPQLSSGGSKGGHIIGSTTCMFFLIQYFIRMLKNKAQIAQESINNNPRASRARLRALNPCRKWVRFHARNVRARI